jgi:hypothetical protein
MRGCSGTELLILFHKIEELGLSFVEILDLCKITFKARGNNYHVEKYFVSVLCWPTNSSHDNSVPTL